MNCIKKKELTIIIPFLNEKYEVENTLQSIREHSNGNVDIILINDASDDGFDYHTVAEKHQAIYLLNKTRLGVAASRDVGVQTCQTPYFLLLDAHMRFYDNNWVERIVNELKSDSKTLLCAQTKALVLDNGFLLEEPCNFTFTYGAFVRLKDKVRMLEPCWIGKDPNPKSLIIPIPCVFGAGYACSKEYWLFLKGLEGLEQYGNDEAYISMKVWMSGGSCKLIKDLIIGHIYRDSSPYSINNTSRLYNRLLLSELLFPDNMKKIFFSESKYLYERDCYSAVLYKLYENTEQINNLKIYYKKILSKGFDYFKQFNDQFTQEAKLVDDVSQILKSITERITNSMITDNGILYGQMGIVIYLYHYAKFTKDTKYKLLSDKLLGQLIQNVKQDLSYSFVSGLCGIGWGIEYLYQNKFIEGDTNEILEEFDKRIMEINPLRIENVDLDYGLGGVVLYLLARLYTIQQEKKSNPFDDEYLSSVFKRVITIISQRVMSCNSLDYFLAFLNYYEKKSPIEKPEIYDVYCLLNHKNIPIKYLDLGLKGCAGVGLSLIFNENI